MSGDKDYLQTRRLAPMTGVPDDFILLIGTIVVQHAFLEAQLQRVIAHIAKLDGNSSVSILSQIRNISTKARILRNLALTKVLALPTQAKLLVLANQIELASKDRNTLIHSLPFGWGKDSIFHLSDVARTTPPIKKQAPTVFTIDRLNALAKKLELLGVWLFMYLPSHAPDGIDLDKIDFSNLTWHPDWDDDSKFPWDSEFQGKLRELKNGK